MYKLMYITGDSQIEKGFVLYSFFDRERLLDYLDNVMKNEINEFY